MHERIETLLHQLDEAIALMAELRTSDPVSIEAFDALKQARALTALAFAPGTEGLAPPMNPTTSA
jgi:hypothetical protein